MAHRGQQEFCLRVKDLLLSFFRRVRVVDFGSLDINGSNRELFEGCDYVGVDLIEGKNVDVVCKAHEYLPEIPVDVVCSTEMLEHDKDWDKSLLAMYRVLRSGGLMFFTCATHGRGEHGTRASSPGDSPATPDYYRNLGPADVESMLNLETAFTDCSLEVNEKAKDLYFWGVKA